MKRRDFNAFLSGAIAGIARGAAAHDGQAGKAGGKSDRAKADAHVCKGHNTCRGKGVTTMNACKGKGECATVRHSCKGKNECKEMGGCACGNRGCAARNSCKEKGGCKVPLETHQGFCAICGQSRKPTGAFKSDKS